MRANVTNNIKKKTIVRLEWFLGKGGFSVALQFAIITDLNWRFENQIGHRGSSYNQNQLELAAPIKHPTKGRKLL